MKRYIVWKSIALPVAFAVMLSISLFSQENLPSIIKRIQPSTVVIITFNGEGKSIAQGSGFFINKNGDVITNRHVIEGASQAEVKANDGKVYRVKKVLAVDNEGDCASLSLENATSDTFPALSLSAAVPEVGEKIIVIGSPLGLEQTVSDGIVSAVRDIPNFGNIIQISAPISPGSSGGPVVNMKGEVIGIATFQYKEGQNLNFAVPSERISKLVVKETRSLSDWNTGENKDWQNSAWGLFQTGLTFSWAGDCQKALPYFEKAIKKASNFGLAYFSLGYCYAELGHYQEALEAYKQAIKIVPDMSLCHYNLGTVYDELGRNQEAVEAYKQAIRINPDDADAHLKLGLALLRLNRSQEAMEALKQSIRINPVEPVAYSKLANIFNGLERYQEAVEACKQAIRINPDFAEAHLTLGITYIKLGRYQEAIVALKQSIRIEPNTADAHYLLGLTYTILEDTSSAMEEYKILKKLNNEEANDLFNSIYQ